MKATFFIWVLLACACCCTAQVTFKSGWDTYKTSLLTHEYTYSINTADSTKTIMTDSVNLYASADSLVIMTVHAPFNDRSVYKTTVFLNAKKQLIKKEEYKNEGLQQIDEYRYDNKERKLCMVDDNKQSGNNFKKLYDYTNDKKSGETVITETSYFNGRIEFYTKTYLDKKNVKLKEVRLNDNNKDVLHIETYVYGENGKVKERTVYFPEWKKTTRFEEKEGSESPKCNKTLPVGTAEKITLTNRMSIIKKLLLRNQALLGDKDCPDYDYKFTNFTNCDIIVSNTKTPNVKKVVFRYKEKF